MYSGWWHEDNPFRIFLRTQNSNKCVLAQNYFKPMHMKDLQKIHNNAYYEKRYPWTPPSFLNSLSSRRGWDKLFLKRGKSKDHGGEAWARMHRWTDEEASRRQARWKQHFLHRRSVGQTLSGEPRGEQVHVCQRHSFCLPLLGSAVKPLPSLLQLTFRDQKFFGSMRGHHHNPLHPLPKINTDLS